MACRVNSCSNGDTQSRPRSTISNWERAFSGPSPMVGSSALYASSFCWTSWASSTLKLGPQETTDIEIKHSLLQDGGVLLLKCFDSTSNKSIAIRVCKEKDKDGEKGGYTDRAHGDEYQLIVLMYILLLAQKAKQCFKLACEFKKAGKFDDIYLHFLKNCTHYFLQLKHRLTEVKEEFSKRAIVFEVDQLKKSKKKKKDEEEMVEKPMNVDGSSNDIIYYHLRGSIDEWMKDKKISFVTDSSFNNLFNSISKCRCINTVRHEMIEPMSENFEDKIGLKKIENIKGAIINIHGDVDSGKTEAALKLLNLILASENEKSTVWINANSQCAIETSFLEVAALLGITTEKDKNGTESRNFVQIINEIYVRLNQMRTIFVFSNVNTEIDINEYLSPFTTNNTIILTSRKCLKNLIKRKLYDRQMEVNQNDYKSYIQQKLSIPATNEEINQLTSKFINRSTIKLVSAYVKTVRKDHDSYTLTAFFHDLEESGKKLGDFIKERIIENHGNTAIQILNMLCYIGQNSVPSAIFSPLENYREALDTLRKYHLVSITDTDFISVHEKIQEVFSVAADKNLNTLLNLVNEYFNTTVEPTKRNECISLTHHLLQTAQIEKNNSKFEHLSTFTNLATVVLQSRCLEDGTSLEILHEYESYLEQNSYPIDVNLKQLKALQNIRCNKFDEALQICSEFFIEFNDISHLETIMPLKITTLKKMGRIRSALREARFWYEKCSSELGSNTESTREALEMIRNCQDTSSDGIKSLRTVMQNHERNVDTENMLLSMVTSEIEVFPENVEDILQALQVLLDATKQLLGDFNVLSVFLQLVQVKYLLQHDVKEAEKILKTLSEIGTMRTKKENAQVVKLCDDIIGNLPISLINDPELLKTVSWKAEALTSEEAFPIWWNVHENTKNVEDLKSLDYLKLMGDHALQQDSTSLTFRLWQKLIVNDFSHRDESAINDLHNSVIRKIRKPTDPTSKETLRVFFSHLDSITKDCSDKMKTTYQMLKTL
ncbi:hypothetical protein B566_EDAN001849, partial [Ephemera danica]